MPVYRKKPHEKVHLYGGKGKDQIHIGPENEPEKWDKKVAEKTLKQDDESFDNYFQKYVENTLLLSLYMPEPERKEYLSKRTAELLARLRRLEEELQKVKLLTIHKMVRETLEIVNDAGKKGVSIEKLNKHLGSYNKDFQERVYNMLTTSELCKIKNDSIFFITREGKKFLETTSNYIDSRESMELSIKQWEYVENLAKKIQINLVDEGTQLRPHISITNKEVFISLTMNDLMSISRLHFKNQHDFIEKMKIYGSEISGESHSIKKIKSKK